MTRNRLMKHTVLRPPTNTRFVLRAMATTFPFLPLSLPHSTCTCSQLMIIILSVYVEYKKLPSLL